MHYCMALEGLNFFSEAGRIGEILVEWSWFIVTSKWSTLVWEVVVIYRPSNQEQTVSSY